MCIRICTLVKLGRDSKSPHSQTRVFTLIDTALRGALRNGGMPAHSMSLAVEPLNN